MMELECALCECPIRHYIFVIFTLCLTIVFHLTMTQNPVFVLYSFCKIFLNSFARVFCYLVEFKPFIQAFNCIPSNCFSTQNYHLLIEIVLFVRSNVGL